MDNRVRIRSVSAVLPSAVRTSEEIEDMVMAASPGMRVRRGTVSAMTGIRTRRVADDGVQCSDLAARAAADALAKAGVGVDEVDVLIFAAAGQDLAEPATAHIVQQKLGTRCQVFDVKNACNSFLNGVQLAESLIKSGSCRVALVATGEVCSRAINWLARDDEELRRNFPGYTMGDAGAAAVLTQSSGRADGGIFYRGFASLSEFWELATIPGGGTMHPRGEEFTFLRGDGARLKQTFVDQGPKIFGRMMEEAGVTFGDFDRIFVHQVSLPYHRDMLLASGMPPDKVERTVEEYGNMASASIPVAFALAEDRGAVRPGDRVMWLGMASGISVGVLMIDV
jgi:acyl-CoA:acyl-CoA alkyltransferase